MTINDFKGRNAKYTIVVCSTDEGEIYEAVPEKAIADIASAFSISNEEALQKLEVEFNRPDGSIIRCPTKNAEFWIEETDKLRYKFVSPEDNAS